MAVNTAASGRELNQYPTVTIDSPKSLPSIAGPTFKFGYKDGIGAFQGWNGGLELPKTIDLGGVRVTRPILRGRKLAQYPTVTIDSPKSLPSIAGPTFKFGYKDGIGAFQGWNGGLELPKTIDLGGVRVTRPILRGRKLAQYPTVTIDSPKSLPSIAGPTFKFGYKDGIGAFQGWNGGLELPKTIDLGGVRVTRPILRGRKLAQYPTVTIDSPKSLPSIAGPTFKFGYKDGIGAFQGWNGGLELPKTIDLGGVRVTRPILRGH
ncbi:hypothetical protein COO60DRAFT_1698697 [Scenedesmus sp. NREL 46B-D3]|nr:hypothetical protein COO60DRAFT_1698697 [Scenedesmus sp. NREL 46B-D3]